jgi:hypothetical protein
MITSGFKSDFLALWLRQAEDRDLLNRIQAALTKSRLPSEYPLKVIPMPINMPAFDYTHKHKYTYRTFLRSDHSSFWFATRVHGDFNLPALLFTDLGT